jgi:uncharacterized membrane protein
MWDAVVSILALCGVALGDAAITIDGAPAPRLVQAELLAPAEDACVGREMASLDVGTVLVVSYSGDLVGARYRLGGTE